MKKLSKNVLTDIQVNQIRPQFFERPYSGKHWQDEALVNSDHLEEKCLANGKWLKYLNK